MKWQNLRNFRCPHCDEKLKREDNLGIIRCSQCRFIIDKTRFIQISEHRSYPQREIIPMKWQNLKEDRCPICSSNLYPSTDGNLEFLLCSGKKKCVFKISIAHLDRILADPNHPANLFYEGEKIND